MKRWRVKLLWQLEHTGLSDALVLAEVGFSENEEDKRWQIQQSVNLQVVSV